MQAVVNLIKHLIVSREKQRIEKTPTKLWLPALTVNSYVNLEKYLNFLSLNFLIYKVSSDQDEKC